MRIKLLFLTALCVLAAGSAQAGDKKHHRHHGWNNETGWYYEEPVRVTRYETRDGWDYYRPNYYYRERSVQGRPARSTIQLNIGN